MARRNKVSVLAKKMAKQKEIKKEKRVLREKRKYFEEMKKTCEYMLQSVDKREKQLNVKNQKGGIKWKKKIIK